MPFRTPSRYNLCAKCQLKTVILDSGYLTRGILILSHTITSEQLDRDFFVTACYFLCVCVCVQFLNIACIVFCDDGVELFRVECVEKLWGWIVHELNVSEVVCVGVE
jgi:hypothetical protein